MRVAAVVALALAVGHGAAVAAGDAADAQRDAREVRSWLTRIHEAADRRNFRGTFVVSAAGVVSSTRIVNYCEGKERIERIDALDGQMRRVLRHNDVVHTLWPSSRVVSIEPRNALASFPSLLQGRGDLRFAEHYLIEKLGSDRVAGLEATLLKVAPRDAHRYGYRLWVEKDSALLLRADVVTERGEVLESSAFSEVSLDVKAQPQELLQPLRKLDGWRVLRPALERTELAAEGWALRVPLPGFREIGCVKRPIDDAGEAAAAQVLQSVWSDGLTYVSVFVEPYDAARHKTPMQTVIGATHTLMRRHGDWWVTVMGEVPAATVRQFAQGLERQPR
jgi:sigma-E factor negative regulatory protein RseB